MDAVRRTIWRSLVAELSASNRRASAGEGPVLYVQ